VTGYIVVAGSRGKSASLEVLDDILLGLVADGIADGVDDWVIIHGACPGSPDISGRDWADARSYGKEGYPANWDRYGKAAGMIRNRVMAKRAAYADFGALFAFWDGKSPGTANMIANACAEGLHVVVRRT
jgi:hypothetical protein